MDIEVAVSAAVSKQDLSQGAGTQPVTKPALLAASDFCATLTSSVSISLEAAFFRFYDFLLFGALRCEAAR